MVRARDRRARRRLALKVLPRWNPERWTGETVAMLAGGPSLTPAAVEQVRRAGIRTVAINTSFRLAPWASVLYAADAKWWQHPEHQDALAFAGDKVCAESTARVLGVSWLKPKLVRYARHSALNITEFAIDNGVARVLLLGVDLDVRRLTHHHGLHPHGLRNPTAGRFNNALGAWAQFAKSTEVEILNCNPDSALTCFPRVPLESVL
jgi:hypothetical protein